MILVATVEGERHDAAGVDVQLGHAVTVHLSRICTGEPFCPATLAVRRLDG
jgi:hypothetical protein